MKMDSMVDVRVRYFPEGLQEQYNRDFARVPLQICSAEDELGATRSQLCFRAHNVSADRRSRSGSTRGHCRGRRSKDHLKHIEFSHAHIDLDPMMIPVRISFSRNLWSLGILADTFWSFLRLLIVSSVSLSSHPSAPHLITMLLNSTLYNRDTP